MPLLVYSLLRLALFGACWVALVWAGLDPWVSVVVAALAAWGLSYAALRRPRDAAARWLAEKDAQRKGAVQLSARARRDAADEDALVEAQAAVVPGEVPGEDPGALTPVDGSSDAATPVAGPLDGPPADGSSDRPPGPRD